MRSAALPLALILALAVVCDALGFGINVDPSTHFGDRFWTVRKLRDRRYAKLKQGIHERITREALADAARRRPGSDPALQEQVFYGLLFNDDPAGYLFPTTPGNPEGYTSADSGATVVNGIKWLEKFGVVVARMKRQEVLEREARSTLPLIGWFFRWRAARELPKVEQELDGDILWASHFGDLQYLHAMGQGDESRDAIVAKMRAYARHAWTAAVGAQSFEGLVAEIAAAQEGTAGPAGADRRQQLMERFQASDILYHTEDAEEFRYRALGSLLHMIQDSFAKGHAVREGWEDQNSGRIRYFQNYAEQDGDKHGAFDTHPSNEVDNWQLIPGATRAMERSSSVVTYFDLGCSWQGGDADSPDCPAGGMESFLFDEVFATVPLPAAESATRSHPEIRAGE